MFVQRKEILKPVINQFTLAEQKLSLAEKKVDRAAKAMFANLATLVPGLKNERTQLEEELKKFRGQYKWNFIAHIYLYFSDRHVLSQLDKTMKKINDALEAGGVEVDPELPHAAEKKKAVRFNEEVKGKKLYPGYELGSSILKGLSDTVKTLTRKRKSEVPEDVEPPKVIRKENQNRPSRNDPNEIRFNDKK